MLTAKKTKSLAVSLISVLLAFMLLIASQPLTTYAAADNPEGSNIEYFPALGTPSNVMFTNYGSINILYSGGTVYTNQGHISSSRGTVTQNNGTIDEVIAGEVDSNYNTITSIRNTGKLGINQHEGTIDFVGMGNEIGYNYGTIKESAGIINENYGTVIDNYGTINTCHEGTITNNHNGGIVEFFNASNTGKVINNDGELTIFGGTVEIVNNTGKINIINSVVTVRNNEGTINVDYKGTLYYYADSNTGKITETAKNAISVDLSKKSMNVGSVVTTETTTDAPTTTPSTTKPTTMTSPMTGANDNALWVAILLASVGTFALTAIYGKRRKKAD